MIVMEEGDLNLSKQLFLLGDRRVNGLKSALNELIHGKSLNGFSEHSERLTLRGSAQVVHKEAHLFEP